MQIKVWLLGINPMVWRRVLVLDTCTLREPHGMIQVAMGCEGIHLYQEREADREAGGETGPGEAACRASLLVLALGTDDLVYH